MHTRLPEEVLFTSDRVEVRESGGTIRVTARDLSGAVRVVISMPPGRTTSVSILDPLTDSAVYLLCQEAIVPELDD